MNKRPYFRKSIYELEDLFVKHPADNKICNSLIYELSFRETKRGKKLLNLILELEELKKQSNINNIIENDKSLELDSFIELNDENEILEQTSNQLESKQINSTFKKQEKINTTSVLEAWIAMEILSPATFKKPEDLGEGNIVRLLNDKNNLPWGDDIKRYKKGYQLYYQIILGSIKMPLSTEKLLKIYADDDNWAEKKHATGETVIASILVDQYGCPANSFSFTISSFAWGLPQALKGDLSILGSDWKAVEEKLMAGLNNHLIIYDENNSILPLNAKQIFEAYNYLVENLELDKDLINPPSFAVCSYQYYKVKKEPEAILLNSFFIDDLLWAKKLSLNNELTDNLKRYLGNLIPENRLNLMLDNNAVRDILSPINFPLASWPSNGRHPLVLLQQCAVNSTMNNLKKDGILAVNGPPGTGKTTLLRDIIVNIITQRAEILAKYDNPEDAFINSKQKMKFGSAFVPIYKLDKKLYDFGIVVASSNNKAVENISMELPNRSAVNEDAFINGYFSTVAKNICKDDAWGMIAAVLGNAKNRNNFRQDFWWSDNSGLFGYLKQASGTPHFVTNEKGEKAIPLIIKNEDPPLNQQDALIKWKNTKKHFLSLYNKKKKTLNELQKIHNLFDELQKYQIIIKKEKKELNDLNNNLINNEKALNIIQNKLHENQLQLNESHETYKEIKNYYPNFLVKLFNKFFNKKNYLKWQKKLDAVQVIYNILLNKEKEILKEQEQVKNIIKNIKYEVNNKDIKFIENSNSFDILTKQYNNFISTYNGVIIDDDFFTKDYSQQQLTTPWLNDEINKNRQDLFEVAMKLHKAFIDAAAKPIRHNCGIFLNDFAMKSLGNEEKDALLIDLWSTFFLIVPVISTTFASVRRMFALMGKDSFAWLLIDEAGQALPQAAVGALLRSKRAVVVGDPLQIEPIVTLPKTLTTKICEQFNIDFNIYSPPQASVQTLADATSQYMAVFNTQYSSREVGIPLLVHRRCSDPMFSISNAVAYENLMVKAKYEKKSEIKNILGDSRWINISGCSQNKWCPEEGAEVINLLQKLKDNNCKANIYLITPFVNVQNNLRQLIEKSRVLYNWVDEPFKWIYENIGTVHTVQGREAEAVIFILGAPEDKESGSRAWAGSSPNLLNVAVTRAKEAVYIIGNRELWKNEGVFNKLNDYISMK